MFDELAHLDVAERGDLFDCLRPTLAVHETAEELAPTHPRPHGLGGLLSLLLAGPFGAMVDKVAS